MTNGILQPGLLAAGAAVGNGRADVCGRGPR